jgi:hypothetical protein
MGMSWNGIMESPVTVLGEREGPRKVGYIFGDYTCGYNKQSRLSLTVIFFDSSKLILYEP